MRLGRTQDRCQWSRLKSSILRHQRFCGNVHGAWWMDIRPNLGWVDGRGWKSKAFRLVDGSKKWMDGCGQALGGRGWMWTKTCQIFLKFLIKNDVKIVRNHVNLLKNSILPLNSLGRSQIRAVLRQKAKFHCQKISMDASGHGHLEAHHGWTWMDKFSTDGFVDG